MSGGASATGPRRGPPGLEEATSKKKQKDRANQESKDGDPRRGGNGIPRVLMASSSFLLTGHTDWELGGYSFAALSWFDAQKRPYTSLSKASALNLGCLTEIQKMVF